MNESVGYYLKRTREVREIELEDVAKKTKISVRFLKAIEEGKWDILPGEVFIKGFLRTYASYLGLNPEELVQRYLQERKVEEKPLVETVKSKSFNLKIIWVALGIFFLFFLLILFIIPRKNKKEERSVVLEEGTKKEIIQEKPKESFEEKKDILNKIELLFTRYCWLRVEIDGKNVFEGFKGAGDKLEYNFKENFILKVGDAGALQVIKDGVPQPRLGEDGQPVLFKIP